MAKAKTRNRKYRGVIQLALTICLLVLVAFIIGSFAYFNDTGKAENYASVGVFKVDLIDIFENNTLTLPGDTVNKDVSMKNNGTRDAVVRVKLTPEWTPALDGQGNERLTDAVTVNLGPDAAADWTFLDGWYYYNRILKPGEETTLLVDSLKLTAVSNDRHRTDYSGAAFDLYIDSESLQATADAAAEQWLVNYTVNGESLTWTTIV